MTIANIDKAMLMTLFADMVNRMDNKDMFLDSYFESIENDITKKLQGESIKLLQEETKRIKFLVNLHKDIIKAEVK